MSNTKLGLPPEYQEFPEYFDVFNINENTESQNAIIEHLLRANKARSVLDVTCGTGSQVFYLAKRGYECIGSDFSPELIKIAKKKAKNAKLNLKFIDGDMRTIKVGTFDAVISIFNAVGHLTKPDFEKAIKNISTNLKVGGIFVFDILNLQAMTDKVVSNLAYHIDKEIKNARVHGIQCSVIDHKSGRLTSFNRVMIQKNSEIPFMYDNKCSLQLYTAAELKTILKRNGFDIVKQVDMDGKKFLPNKSLNILTVARKAIV